MIVAGDLGGTKSNLGTFDPRNGKLVPVAEEHLDSHKYASVEALVQDYISQTNSTCSAACFGVAGPVVDNAVRASNLPWMIQGDSLARLLKIPSVRLLNDLEATCYGLEVLAPSELECIHEGTKDDRANKVIIAAGTGLGEGVIFWDGDRHFPSPTEGGHADWAPHTEQQCDLWRFLKARNDIVSSEIILSGRGFKSLHEFLNPNDSHPEFNDPTVDPAPIITQGALDKSCATCVATLDLWVDIYGSEAGNLAIRNVARGGIFIAGGIAVKILSKLKDGRFAKAVAEKEKLGYLLSQIPIYVVMNEKAPLLGAAHVAAQNGK
jgi:glucokinase